MKSIRKVFFVLIVCSFLFVTPKAFGLYEDISYEEMIERADLIVIGQNKGAIKERTETVRDAEEDRTIGYTDWEIEVSSYLKGDSEGKRINLSTPGASNVDVYRSGSYRLDEWIEGIEEELSIKVGDVLFFLEERDGYYHPITPKAIVPINVIYWEDHIDNNVIHEDEMDPVVIEELAFLQTYIEDTPQYAPSGELLNPSYQNWILYGLGSVLILIGGKIMITRRRNVKSR
ncbi:hypothetical protein LCL95_01415 [Bacillus timonensis]|nr:hypothetical protein [Bacillus timonensis]